MILTFFTCSAGPLFDAKFIEQFRLNVYYYAELLFRWQLYYKRLELLKAVDKQDILAPSDKVGPHRIGMSSDVIDFLRGAFNRCWQAYIDYASEVTAKTFFLMEGAHASIVALQVPCPSVPSVGSLSRVGLSILLFRCRLT
jgi:hypothetical protein